MNEILEISFPIPEQIEDTSMEKIGKTIEPDVCLVDNTSTDNDVVCYM